MADKLRIGVVGLVHDHVWGILGQFRKLKDAEGTCATDMNEPLLADVRKQGVKTHKSCEKLLAEEEIDAIDQYSMMARRRRSEICSRRRRPAKSRKDSSHMG